MYHKDPVDQWTLNTLHVYGPGIGSGGHNLSRLYPGTFRHKRVSHGPLRLSVGLTTFPSTLLLDGHVRPINESSWIHSNISTHNDYPCHREPISSPTLDRTPR